MYFVIHYRKLDEIQYKSSVNPFLLPEDIQIFGVSIDICREYLNVSIFKIRIIFVKLLTINLYVLDLIYYKSKALIFNSIQIIFQFRIHKLFK